MGNSLAESWSESPDGLLYEFKLRQGLRFHNGRSLHGRGVKFTFERYKGAGARELKDNGQAGRSLIPDSALPVARALARLHDVLWHHGHGRCWVVPKK